MHRMYVPASACIVVIIAAWALATGGQAATLDPDHALYLATVEQMRDGVSYYAAMDDGLRDLYGVGVGSVFAFRLPTAFAVWAQLPTAWLWPVFVVGGPIAAGLIAARLSHPWAGVAVAIWLFVTGQPHLATGPHAQWLLLEFWAIPFALAAVWRYEQDDDLGAATAALVAAAVRELAAPLLVVGLLLPRRRRAPWGVAVACYLLLLVLHVRRAGPLVSLPGGEPRLLGSGGLDEVAAMATVLGPWPLVVLWVVAVVLAIGRRRWMLAPLVALPVLGLAVNRSYWGVLTVPAVFVLVFERWPDMLAGGWRRQPTASSTS